MVENNENSRAFSSEPVDEEVDLMKELGIEDKRNVQIHVFKHDPKKGFGVGDLAGRLDAESFNYPEDIARLGPGEYILRPFNKKYLKGQLKIGITETMAKEAGWKPEGLAQQSSYVSIPPDYDFVKKQMEDLKQEIRYERDEKTNILASVMNMIANKPHEKETGTDDKLVAFLQQSNLQFQALMKEITESRVQSTQVMMQMMQQMHENSLNVLQGMTRHKSGPDIGEILSFITPLLSRSSGEKFAELAVEMFKTGFQTGTGVEKTGGFDWGEIAKMAVPFLLAGGGKLPLGFPQANPQAKQEASKIQGSVPNQPLSTGEPQRQVQPQKGNSEQKPPPSLIEIMDKIEKGDVDVIKAIFLEHVGMALSHTSDKEMVYNIVSASLPRIVHEKLADIKLEFSDNEGISKEFLTYVLRGIKLEYEENLDESADLDETPKRA